MTRYSYGMTIHSADLPDKARATLHNYTVNVLAYAGLAQ